MTIDSKKRGGSGGGGGINTTQINAPGAAGSVSITTTPQVLISYNTFTTIISLGGVSITKAGTLRNLVVEVVVNSLAGTSGFLEVYKNGVGTGILVEFTVGGPLGPLSDLVNTDTVAVGDYVSFVFYSVGSNPTGSIRSSIPSVEILYS